MSCSHGMIMGLTQILGYLYLGPSRGLQKAAGELPGIEQELLKSEGNTPQQKRSWVEIVIRLGTESLWLQGLALWPCQGRKHACFWYGCWQYYKMSLDWSQQWPCFSY